MSEPNLGLALADGSRWVIRALDVEAEATVRELGKAMQLGPTQGGGKLCAVSGQKEARGRQGAAGRGLSCRLGPGRGWRTEVLRIERIATAIAAPSLARRGLLLHGALAVRDGVGFILAGPSGAGKSTASRRLPAPWRSLSDDCVLVVRDPDGPYWAHPWPTWSFLRDNGPVATWPVEQAVPLKALMFLTQSSVDRAEPVAATPATALIMESAVQLARTVVFTPDGNANRAVCAKYLRAAWALAAVVSAFRLHVSLTGQFWNEIERAVPTEPQMDTDGHGYGVRTERNAELREEGTTADYADGRRYRHRIEQNSETRNQNAELRKDGAAAERGKATNARRRRSVPEPPRRLLSGSPKPRLVRFQAGQRTFLKLMAGRRVVASVNDVLREWHVRRPSRRVVNERTVRRAGSRSSRSGVRD